MTTWRVGRRNPHTVYRQHGGEPRGYEHDDHDDSLGYFRFPEDALRAVEAVNAEHARTAPHASIRIDRSATELTATCKCGESEVFPIGGDAEARRWWETHGRAPAQADELRAIVEEIARNGMCDQWSEPGDEPCPETRRDAAEWCPVCRARKVIG